MSKTDYEDAIIRDCALTHALKRNKGKPASEVIKEAEIFSQFLDRRADAKVTAIRKKRK